LKNSFRFNEFVATTPLIQDKMPILRLKLKIPRPLTMDDEEITTTKKVKHCFHLKIKT